MPELDLHILTVVRTLDDAGAASASPVLVEGALHPEFCAFDAREGRARLTLRDALRKHFEDADPIELHRHTLASPPALRELTVTLDPTANNSVAWSEQVVLRFQILQWQHGEDAHVAFVPALGIEVAATKAEELDKLLPEHIRFALRRSKAAASLQRLAQLDRVRDVRLEPLEICASIKDPKQAAKDEDDEEDDDEKPVIEHVGSVLSSGTARTAFENDALVAQLADALGGRAPHSVLLVGPAGVGKTAAVRELVRSRGALGLADKPFWSTSGARLVAGMSGFGMWQERTGKLVKQATKAGAVLHVGSLIELMEVGRGTMVGQGIASFLRPHVGRGDVLVIAECTPEQLPAIEREDPHLLAAFRQIKVDEPTREVGRKILEAVAGPAAPITPAALDALDQLHRRYAGYSAYPGRPIRFLQNLLKDSAAAADERTVVASFARETGLPPFMLDDAVPLDLPAMRAWLAGRVIGQTDAVDLVTDLLATVKAGLNRPRRPIASLLFIGPTGVGKTEMAKTLAEFFFSDPSRVSRFDMSEYASPGAVARLVGGVFGTEGLLTAKVREQPFSVILLDEFEKADPSLFDLLLQVLGEGRLTDAAGRVADFSNAVVIMTSNLGAESFQRGGFGLKADANAGADAKRHFVESVRDAFRPELFNRIDRVVPFVPLDRAVVAAITRRELDLVTRRDGVRLRGVELDVTDAAVTYLADRGFDAKYGARPLKRAIERELLVPLAEAINTYPEQVRLTAAVDAEVSSSARRLSVVVRAKLETSGRQASALASGSSAAAIAARVSTLRRRVQRLERSAGVLALRNEIFRLLQAEERERRLQRRLRGPARYHVPHDVVRAARMARLNGVESALARVAARTIAIEDALLQSIYDTAAATTSAIADAELLQLERENAELPLALYALRFTEPDAITLAFYGEHPRPLLELARAFHDVVARQLGGTTCLSWFKRREPEQSEPGDRFRDKSKEVKKPKAEKSAEPAKAVKLDRVDEPSAPAFLNDHHPDVVGVVLAIRCANALPRFQHEPGLHLVKDGTAESTCLVEQVNDPIVAYKPPADAGTRGWIVPGVPSRTYDVKRLVLLDSAIGEVTYADRLIDEALREILDRVMNAAASDALDG